jgi:outer membrane PBP1 activator LpoA protein
MHGISLISLVARRGVWLILFAALYVSPSARATDAPAAVKPAPHIALLLPQKSATFGEAAKAVRQGFMAAASGVPSLPIRVYESSDERAEVAALYRTALANGARAVVGPLTRDGVAALAATSAIPVPTLALNLVEVKGAEQLHFFGLPAEAEARQVAKLAALADLHNAILVSDGKPLSRRLTQAFAEEWKRLGGNVVGEVRYNDDPAPLAELPAAQGNMVFLAADAEQAHLIRPYLNLALPVYATSQVFNGNADTLTNYDLHDVHFVDMPWLVQPDHPAVMIYPRADPPGSADMERLYALGIDAFRLSQIMLDNSYRADLPLDGVTGRIQQNDSRQFLREAIPAIFSQGRGMTPEEVAALAAARAAALAAKAASAAVSAIPAALPADTPP